MRPIKGGPEDRQYANTLRKRVKRGKQPLSDEEKAWLSAWDERAAAMPKGRPKKDVQQSVPETAAEGGAGKTDPSIDSPNPAPPADPVVPSMPASLPLEAPPAVPLAAPRVDGAAGKDWRDKYRTAALAVDDGREMLCLQIASGVVSAIESMNDDMKKAGVEPLLESWGIAAKQLLPIYVLGLDDLLPAKARMTPKIAMMATTTLTVGQRYYHHKKIADVLKRDPDTLAWKQKQAEREKTEAAQRAANAAEVDAAKKSAAVKLPDPPPENKPDPTLNGRRTYTPTKPAVTAEDSEPFL